ncbi:MAG: twin-arginine translocase TatA/TatE family subunit [Desulfobulbaceae bacterium]|nr:twin-arginine translocase TatA/TatE family subunit [Desulfobulbaceae bacterium]
MFGIGLPELLLIMGLGLVVLGPDKLPELAKQLAKGMVELKRTANALKDSLQDELKEEGVATPLLGDLDEPAGQPWRGLDGKGVSPSDTLPEGFQEFSGHMTESLGGDLVVNNTPIDASAAADAGADAEGAMAQAAPAASDTVAEATPDQPKEPAA